MAPAAARARPLPTDGLKLAEAVAARLKGNYNIKNAQKKDAEANTRCIDPGSSRGRIVEVSRPIAIDCFLVRSLSDSN